ncbi:MAG: c-type cytochrome [Betaproteobacteria bacterium]
MMSLKGFTLGIPIAVLGASLHAQELSNAKAVYDANCAACHATGAGGAPRIGDAAAWSRRFDAGISIIYANAIKGKGTMPPKGGNATLTDSQVMAAVTYIMSTTAVPNASTSSPRSSAKPSERARAATIPGPDPARGKQVYQATCAACHTTGLAGAPKPGDGSAWTARLSAGAGPLYGNAIKGKAAMPPKGGNASLSDAEVRAAVDFMLTQVRGASAPAEARPPETTSPVSTAPAPFENPVASVVPASGPASTMHESTDPNAFNRLMVAPNRRNRSPSEDGIHDPTSPGTVLLQAPLASFQSLPRANLGNYVDWGAALGRKQIQPRWDVRNPKAEATVMDMNIVREVKGSMPDVVFPHKQHTEWLDCSNCHPAIFTPQKGANVMSMASIMLGQQCGVCHGKVAFPISECRLCHARQKNAGPTFGRNADRKSIGGALRNEFQP